MKKTIKSLFAIAIAAFAFTACSDVEEPYTIPTKAGSDVVIAEPEGDGATPTTAFNVAAILEKLDELGGVESTEDYYIKGKVASIKEAFSANFGNAQFTISDDGTTSKTFTAYRVKYLENKAWAEGNTQIQVGDEVILYGKVVIYNGTYETAQNKAYLYSLNGKTSEGITPPEPTDDYINESFSADFGSFTVSTIKGTPWVIDFKTAKASGYDNGTKTTTESESYLVSKEVDLTNSKGAYLEFEYILRYASQGTNKIYATTSYTGDPATTTWTDITGTYTEGKDWTTFASYKANLPAEFIGKNKVVIAFYYSCSAANSATMEIKNLALKEGSVSDDTDPEPGTDEIKTATVAEFNAAAESTTVWYKLTGTVKNLKDGDNYGNFDLEDETGSVYVYGLLATKGGEKKKFQDLVTAKGIANDKKITIIGNRGSFNGKIEVVNAYFDSIE